MSYLGNHTAGDCEILCDSIRDHEKWRVVDINCQLYGSMALQKLHYFFVPILLRKIQCGLTVLVR